MKKIVLVLLILISIFSCAKKPEKGLKTVLISPQTGNIALKVLATGSISPYRRIEIKASDKGRVEKIFYNEGQYVHQGEILALLSTLDRISLLDTARANLYKAQKSADPEQISIAQEDLKTAEQAYNPVPIITPVAGEIINRNIEIGEFISADTVLFVLSDRLILRIRVDEADIGKIRLRQKVSFYLDTFPDEINQGIVEKISKEGVLDSNIMEYEVIVFPLKVSPRWIAGMTVNAEFYITDKKNIMTLPFEAVKKFRDKNFVVVEKNKKQELKEVEAGITDYKNIEIISGITKDDKIAVLSTADMQKLFRSRRDPSFRMRRMMP